MSNIITYTGVHFDPTQASAEDFRIEDIAHALSLMCRGNGHLHGFYSVAQHAIACAQEAAAREYSRDVQRFCLLHDASEAYLSDITRPIKAHLPRYREIEAAVQDAIYTRFAGRTPTAGESEQIRSVDDCMLYHEFIHLMGEAIFPSEPPIWRLPDYAFHPFSEVAAEFLAMFEALS